MVGLLGGSLIGLPYWLVATLIGIGFVIGLGFKLAKRASRKRQIALVKLYAQEGDGIYGRRRKLYD